MWLALAAYFTYVINAAQFIRKLRMARLAAPPKNDIVGNNAGPVAV